MKDKIKYFILMQTYPIWHPVVFSILCRCRTTGIIDDVHFYNIAAFIDRTQEGSLIKKAAFKQLGTQAAP